MASWTNPFPSWGDAGEQPPSGKDYGVEQVNEKHFDYLWDRLNKTFDQVLDHVLQDDGSVAINNDTFLQWRNNADSADVDAIKLDTNDEVHVDTVLNVVSDIVTSGGTTIWDNSAGRIGNGLVAAASIATDAVGASEIDLSIAPTWTGLHRFDSGVDTRGDIVDNTTTIWDSTAGTLGSSIVNAASIVSDAIGTSELDLSITPTWTGKHTFNGGADADFYDLDGSKLAQSIPASGQTTLSGGSAVVDTAISATDATFMLALGIDDPDADTKVSGRIFWDDSAGTYKIEIVESGTSVGNPTVNYDVIRVR